MAFLLSFRKSTGNESLGAEPTNVLSILNIKRNINLFKIHDYNIIHYDMNITNNNNNRLFADWRQQKNTKYKEHKPRQHNKMNKTYWPGHGIISILWENKNFTLKVMNEYKI